MNTRTNLLLEQLRRELAEDVKIRVPASDGRHNWEGDKTHITTALVMLSVPKELRDKILAGKAALTKPMEQELRKRHAATLVKLGPMPYTPRPKDPQDEMNALIKKMAQDYRGAGREWKKDGADIETACMEVGREIASDPEIRDLAKRARIDSSSVASIAADAVYRVAGH